MFDCQRAEQPHAVDIYRLFHLIPTMPFEVELTSMPVYSSHTMSSERLNTLQKLRSPHFLSGTQGSEPPGPVSPAPRDA